MGFCPVQILKIRMKCLTTHLRFSHYMTTPIFYVNSCPHIGHLYTSVLADALHRYEKLKNSSAMALFMTGTDEHGLKIQKAADERKISVKSYVDDIASTYKNMFRTFNVNYTDFLRTTESRHAESVTELWIKLSKAGHIYKGEYSGWYCIPDEAFISEQFLQTHDNGVKTTIDGNRPVEFVREENYKFRLGSFKAHLLDWLRVEGRVKPDKFQRMLVDWIEEGSVLEDISVSRPRNRVSWGVSVPGDDSHTIYVWLDALSCYLTSVGFPRNLKAWPPDVQIIGKDILKFHGIFWPAFLMGAGLEPPKKLLCHSHWIIDGEKMSKSKGNVVDPFLEADKYTSDGLRYFLLREGVPHSDGNYTSTKVYRALNAELADTLGNLLNRCTGKIVNSDQVFPAFSSESHDQHCDSSVANLLQSVQSLPDIVCNHFENFEIYKAIDAIIATLHLANGLFEIKKPWELRKNPDRTKELLYVLHVTMETLRICGILLLPIVPTIASNLLSKLNIPDEERYFKNTKTRSWQTSVGACRNLDAENVVLYKKLKLVN